MVVILPEVKKWFYKDSVVKVVNAYKYLGVWFRKKFIFPSFLHSLESQTTKAKAGIVQVLKTLWNLAMFLRISCRNYLIHKLNL